MGSLFAANPGSTLFEAGETVDLFVIDRVEDILLPGQIIPFNINDVINDFIFQMGESSQSQHKVVPYFFSPSGYQS